MKNLRLALSATFACMCLNGIPCYRVSAAEQTLNGGTATVDCIPKQGLALWSLRTFDDPMFFVNTRVGFSKGSSFSQSYFTAPSFEQDGAESSNNPAEQWVTFEGNALGTFSYFAIPPFRDICN